MAGTTGALESMNSRSLIRVLLSVVILTLAVSACGEPSPEILLEKSRKIPELYQFGVLYVPLYQQAVVDSNWTAIQRNIRELVSLERAIGRLEVPENIRLQKQEWERDMRLFNRAVGNLSVVMGWRGERADSSKVEIAEGVQAAYDWWQMLVEMIR